MNDKRKSLAEAARKYRNTEKGKAKQKAWYEANKADILEKQKVYREKNPWYVDKQRVYARIRSRSEKVKKANRKNQLSYIGWTPELYNKVLQEQDGKCAICQKLVEGRQLDADHEHTVPPKPRGLLCNKHNQMLGLAEDSISILEATITYLKKYQQ